MYTKEQVLKEWDKIKAYDILDTIEELESLFQEKPYGKCMRKYTAYPWCKENFFLLLLLAHKSLLKVFAVPNMDAKFDRNPK